MENDGDELVLCRLTNGPGTVPTDQPRAACSSPSPLGGNSPHAPSSPEPTEQLVDAGGWPILEAAPTGTSEPSMGMEVDEPEAGDAGVDGEGEDEATNDVTTEFDHLGLDGENDGENETDAEMNCPPDDEE